MQSIKFIDLFAGMGGFRLGFEQAVLAHNYQPTCVFSSEIKPYAIQVYKDNYNNEEVAGDITKINSSEIPDFDVLLAGFPCQAFSSAGKRQGFLDTRGTMFFEVERILKEKRPKAFILENVEGLVKHDLLNKTDEMGQTLTIILQSLRNLGYMVSWKVLDASNFGVPQARKRIYITGTLGVSVNLENFEPVINTLDTVLEKDKPLLQGKLIDLLLSHYSIDDLYGKSVKDKRGGSNNIHSWDIELKGSVSKDQRELLGKIMRARRNKKWADLKGIQWMDGMPLTLEEIKTFYDHPNLKEMLDDLCEKKYVKLEHPKDVVTYVDENGIKKQKREYREDIEKGYNIVAGKLSYEINKILDPKAIAPTLVATDLDRIVVPDGKGLRLLTEVEQKRLFGFPDDYILNIKPKEAFDLFGNTVAVPVVKAVSSRLLETLSNKNVEDRKPTQQLELI
ncbi:DNA (cytosine-5-)-methyltransferase [Acinetobacter baumannii]|uniref:DNA (cytosine-5-)-methyltransferase n=1 Tax=Acinetobacter baumannii TaxID=470 RepID=UPI0024B67D2B|nr:DNA (cytosine-5-)-methyltransferase [Acinetobacter baumannii]MCZ3063568.1 DNA (cytosine-5-)-methyltransferase [Acinetobacter baumannii]MDI9738914.1 DNA (cytosine-5-)-methyltransferase [Acinetobacter baumannii]